MEKLAYDERGNEICKPIEPKQKRLCLVFDNFADKEREKILKAFNNMGIQFSEHFWHPNGTHEHTIKS